MIALIDYGAGNLRSVENALAFLGAPSFVAADPQDLSRAQAIIFPGVGAAGPAMTRLSARGLDRAIRAAAAAGIPFLGICLGLQVLFESSAEDGRACLGILDGTVERLPTREKLPHVGWNTAELVRAHPLFDGLAGASFYFVHAFGVAPRNPDDVLARTTHGVPFVSAVARGTLMGVQFHPERSGAAGLRLLENFLSLARGERRPHALQASHPLP